MPSLSYQEAGGKHGQGYNITLKNSTLLCLYPALLALPSAWVISSLKGNGQFKESEWEIVDILKGAFKCSDKQYTAGRGGKRCQEHEK